jgi:hypothetical protein
VASTSNITSIYNVFVAVAHGCKYYRPDQKKTPGRTVGGAVTVSALTLISSMITNTNGKIQVGGLEAGIAFGLISTAEIRDCGDRFSPKVALKSATRASEFGQERAFALLSIVRLCNGSYETAGSGWFEEYLEQFFLHFVSLSSSFPLQVNDELKWPLNQDAICPTGFDDVLCPNLHS